MTEPINVEDLRLDNWEVMAIVAAMNIHRDYVCKWYTEEARAKFDELYKKLWRYV